MSTEPMFTDASSVSSSIFSSQLLNLKEVMKLVKKMCKLTTPTQLLEFALKHQDELT
jgi:hypothetical protein